MPRVSPKIQEARQHAPKDEEVTRIGNLTRDPELHQGPSQPWAATSLAVTTPVIPNEWGGEKQTTYYDIVVFGDMAVNFAASCRKGDRVIVVGRPEVRTYSRSDGTEGKAKRILASAIGPDLRWAEAVPHKVKPTASPIPAPEPSGNVPLAEAGDDEPF
jgi:single-stranded DNA-binding protein